MNQPTRNRSLPVVAPSDRAVALSLLIGGWISVTIVVPETVVSAETLPQPVQQPAAEPVTKPALIAPIPVAKRLLGQWLTKEPLDGEMVMLVFTPGDTVFILSGTSASGNAIGRQFQYRIDDQPRPMHLDVILTADATVKSVFEFTANDELRLQVVGTRPRNLRPAALTNTATLFQKLSDDTKLPPGAEVEKPVVQQKKSLNEFRFGDR